MKDAIDPYDQVIQIYAPLNIKEYFISYLSSAKYIQYMFVSIYLENDLSTQICCPNSTELNILY